MCSSPERKRSPGLSWLACWCYFPFAFAAVCDRNCRFSWPKRRRRCWKHVAGISRKLPANAVQVFRLHQVLFSWWKSLYVLPVPSVSPWFLPPCPFVANTDLTLLCRLSPPFSIILSLLPPSLFFFFFASASMLQSADKEHPVQMDSSLSRSRCDCRPEHVISPVAMFASIWYAKKLGRRLVQSSRKAKLLKDEVSLKVLCWAWLKRQKFRFHGRFWKKKRT